MQQRSFIEGLKENLVGLTTLTNIMLDNSEVYYYNMNDHSDSIFIGFSSYHYNKKDEKTQLILKSKYKHFYERFELLLENVNADRLENIQETHGDILNLIEQKDAPASIEGGKAHFVELTNVYNSFLDLFITPNTRIILVPDTNVIIQHPDPISYKKIIPTNFTFVIVPTVLSELDKHKHHHRDESFRNKAKSVVKRLKGYGQQGDILTGVTVDQTITVKMIPTEPRFSKTLKWLDPNNSDDRIIASILEIQIKYASDNVMLITSDINLQNKARLAGLSFIDSDELD